ncbi:hypothetical protein HFN_1484 [Helicobacter fennelliae MRY12-0050]|uniref:Uncharacterized protein n=1 Tax=Helicobacter fennelliae MRY12-0050 TaxID=1325130 RepID=T1CVW8_9HELI|nr:hypothetical protein HFN_1484 [Helicobacter fennelliae MRY12-0050]
MRDCFVSCEPFSSYIQIQLKIKMQIIIQKYLKYPNSYGFFGLCLHGDNKAL